MVQQVDGIAGVIDQSFIHQIDAYQYDLDQVKASKDLQQEFVEWFFSGNSLFLLNEEFI